MVKATPILRRHILISTDYRVLGGVDEARQRPASSAGWLAARTVARQERAYQALIAAMKRGEPRLDFSVAAEAVAATGIATRACSRSAAAAATIRRCSPTLLPGGVALHRHRLFGRHDRPRPRPLSVSHLRGWPTRPGCPTPDGAFDIVFNGVSLMHIIDYQAAIREAARVASRYCIFHTVPVFDDHQTTFLRNTPMAHRSSRSSSASRN